MQTIVITGSTRGIGYGLAEALLDRDCQVVISGRRQATVDAVVRSLSERYPTEHILGKACDVSSYEQVKALWDTAVGRFGAVDIWVNNAALASAEHDFWQHDPDTIEAVVQTNLNGVMYGCKVAVEGMLAQGHGHVYNMEGWGSQGEIRAGSALYGSTKAAITYFTKTLLKELEDTPVRMGSISPGMVVTDMLNQTVRPGREENMRRIVNILGDRVETVAPWMADEILADDKHGARLAWLSTPQVFWRFLTARFRRRNIADDMNLGTPAESSQL